jgi:hypothetical protein
VKRPDPEQDPGSHAEERRRLFERSRGLQEPEELDLDVDPDEEPEPPKPAEDEDEEAEQ